MTTDIIYTLEGINGGKEFEQMPFPENDKGLDNGTLLAPTKDMPWFRLSKGQEFQTPYRQ